METGMSDVAQRQESVDPTLVTALQTFADAFNRFDVQKVASFWAEDGTLINPAGDYGKGHSGVGRVYGHDSETLLEGTTSRFTILKVRQVGDNCAFVDLDHEIDNCKLPDGSTQAMKLHLVILAQKQGSGWHWLDARPYAFLRAESIH